MLWNKHSKLEEEALKNYTFTTNTLSTLTKKPYSPFNFLIKQQLEVELFDSKLLLKQYEILNNHLVLPTSNQVGYALPVDKLYEVLAHMRILNLKESIGQECISVHELCKQVFYKGVDKYWSVPGLTEEVFVNLLVKRYTEDNNAIPYAFEGDNALYNHYYQPYIKGEYHEFAMRYHKH